VALVLSRRNGAPLGGALFVSNPSRRKRRAAAKKRRAAPKRRRVVRRRKRRNAPKRRRAAPKRRNASKRSAAARKGAATRRRNALKRSRAAKKAAATRRRNTRKGQSRKTARRAYTKRRNALALRTNRRNRRNPRNRRNALALRTNRRNRRNALALRTNRRRRRTRRNPTASESSFRLSGIAQKIYTPVAKILKKIPYVGKPIAAALPTGAYFLAAAATHHYIARPLVGRVYSMVPMGIQSAVAPVTRFIAPAQSFLTGVLVAAILQNKRIPLKPATKKQLAVAVIGSGAVIDALRYYAGSDYSGVEKLYQYNGAYGDGMSYDVIPLGALAVEYNGAQAVDAAACPADFSIEEGEAALAGPGYWKQYFGPPPQRISAGKSPYSNYVGREGHRWGWLISMIGFERFSKIAAMPPQHRVQLLAELKGQAIQLADRQIAQSAASTVPDTGALALDMNGTLFAGAL
jgi:hypothetical protein